MLMNVRVFALLLVSLFVKGSFAQVIPSVIQNTNTSYYLTALPPANSTSPAICFVNNVPLGHPNTEGTLRVYSNSECVNNLGGLFNANGECSKVGGGSWSWDCHLLNFYYFSLVMSPTCNATQLCLWNITAQNQILLAGTSWAITYVFNATTYQNLKVMDLGNVTAVQQFRFDSPTKNLVSGYDSHVIDILGANRNVNATVGVYSYTSGWNQQFMISSGLDIIFRNDTNYLNKTITALAYSFLSNQGNTGLTTVGVASFWEMFDVVMNNQSFGYLLARSGPSNAAQYCALSPTTNYVICNQSNRVLQFQFNVSSDQNSFTMKTINGSGNNYCQVRNQNGNNLLFCDASVATQTTFWINYQDNNQYLNTTLFTYSGSGYSFLSNQGNTGLTTVGVASVWEMFDVGMNNQSFGYLRARSGPFGGYYCALSPTTNYTICDQSNRIIAFQFNVSADQSSFTMKAINGNGNNYCQLRNNLLYCDASVATQTTFLFYQETNKFLNEVIFTSSSAYSFLSNQGNTGLTTVGVASVWEMFDVGMNNQSFGYLRARDGPYPYQGNYCALSPTTNYVICNQSNRVLQFLYNVSSDQSSFTMKTINGNGNNYCQVRNQNGHNLLYCDASVTTQTTFLFYQETNTYLGQSITASGFSLFSNQTVGLTTANEASMFDVVMNDQSFGYVRANNGSSGGNYCALSPTTYNVFCDQSNQILQFQFNVSSDQNSFTMKTINGNGNNYCQFRNQTGNNLLFCDASVATTMNFVLPPANNVNLGVDCDADPMNVSCCGDNPDNVCPVFLG